MLDLAGGFVSVRGDATSFTRLHSTGVGVAAEYGQPNFLAAVSRYERVSTDRGPQHAGFIGARVGSFGAPIAVALGIGITFALFALAMSGG